MSCVWSDQFPPSTLGKCLSRHRGWEGAKKASWEHKQTVNFLRESKGRGRRLYISINPEGWKRRNTIEKKGKINLQNRRRMLSDPQEMWSQAPLGGAGD